MMRKDFGAQPWLYPQPVLILGTYDKNGKGRFYYDGEQVRSCTYHQ